MQETRKAIIIGAGVAGLATSIRLAVLGFEVHVYEKNIGAGGKITSFMEEGFSFDKGPSLFTQPQNLEEIFTIAGANIADYISYKCCAINCRYFFHDGTRLIAYADKKAFQNELQQKLNEPGGNVEKYLAASKNWYESMASIFLIFSLHKKTTWLQNRIFIA